ncbi:anaerobic ribonucleoside-triphosphate reductase [Candidatus Dependentiae bacterium]|nr:MAG: anaerobic ribonucleoside-triphosphate reductase [Candidatus Dependentiae bacterium]
MEKSNYLAGFSQDFQKIYYEVDEALLRLEGIDPEHLNVSAMSARYFSERIADMSIDVNANSNEGKSYGGYISEVVKGWLKLQGYYDLYRKIAYLFGVERAQHLLKSVWNGDLYVHDSTAIQIPYCWAYSTHFLLERGNFWGPLQSLPPTRSRSFIDQVKEVTIEIAQGIAGAVAISDLFVNYAYFIQKEKLDITDPAVRKDIENDFQSLVHTLNKKLRISYQSPFTNFSIFDRPNLEYLFGELRYPDGSIPDFDLIEEIQRIFCNWFSKGDPVSGLPYRFPVVTLNLRVDKKRQILDKKSLEYFSSINVDKGCFNIYISTGNKIASCCRLINDLELAGCDSFGNGGISLGSHRVVTLNLARIGRLAQSVEHAIELLKERLIDARDILISHRNLLKDRINQGFLKFFNYDVMHIDRFFSTFGISGIYECMEEIGMPLTTKQGREGAHQLIGEIKQFAHTCSKETGSSFNIEQVPGEGLAVSLASKDRLVYGMNYSIYANQFIPLWVPCDIVDRIKIDGEFSRSLTGGGITHLNLGERLTSQHQMKKIIKYAVTCGCEHFAINYNFCSCVNKHITIAGPSERCPLCSEPIVDQYTRIIGYFTPVSTWNKGRQYEHKNRIFTDNGILLGDHKVEKKLFQ